MLSMRPSRVLEKLRRGEVAISFKHNLNDPRSVEIAALCGGFDCHWLCMEHTPNDWSDIERQIYAAKAYNADVLVRVARGSYSDYVRPLELDASGIMVPHVMSAADARTVVRTTRFHPIGRRPVDGGNADGAYCNIEFREYLRQANERRFLAIQIEDPEPLEELEEICAVPGIDIVFFGPGDFSHGLGIPGEMSHPKILETRRRIAEVATKHGKFPGTTATPDTAPDLIKMGYRFLNVGADVLGLSAYCKTLSQRLSAAMRA